MIVHVDMDAFFASVEQMDNPALRGRPVMVGGGDRGVVATASYEARRFGVHSAMPAGQARRLCPQGVFVRPRFDRYKELSGKVMEVLRAHSPLVEQASIDEAYLDAEGMERVHPQGYGVGPGADQGRIVQQPWILPFHRIFREGQPERRSEVQIRRDQNQYR